jgi:hypothetical protein
MEPVNVSDDAFEKTVLQNELTFEKMLRDVVGQFIEAVAEN